MLMPRQQKIHALVCADPANPNSAKRVAEELRLKGTAVTVISDFSQFFAGGKKGLEKNVSNLVAKNQLVFMLGGDKQDVAPERYLTRFGDGSPKKKRHPETNSESDYEHTNQRAQVESLIIKEVFEHKIPVVGICYGSQQLWEESGGTLHQELFDVVGHTRHSQATIGIPDGQPSHAITVEPNTEYAHIAGMPNGGTDLVNSRHHQSGGEKPPKGLIVSAYALEKHPVTGKEVRIPEVIETNPRSTSRADHWVLGIQSHPELLDDRTRIKAVVNRAMEKAKEYAVEHPGKESNPGYRQRARQHLMAAASRA
jgi:gamma-glutamyl-gamma-aminobutyrate hydrolase PuuD